MIQRQINAGNWQGAPFTNSSCHPNSKGINLNTTDFPNIWKHFNRQALRLYKRKRIWIKEQGRTSQQQCCTGLRSWELEFIEMTQPRIPVRFLLPFLPSFKDLLGCPQPWLRLGLACHLGSVSLETGWRALGPWLDNYAWQSLKKKKSTRTPGPLQSSVVMSKRSRDGATTSAPWLLCPSMRPLIYPWAKIYFLYSSYMLSTMLSIELLH